MENTGIFPYIAGEFKRGSHLFAGEFKRGSHLFAGDFKRGSHLLAGDIKRGSHVLWGVTRGRTMLRGTLTLVIQFAGDVMEGEYIPHVIHPLRSKRTGTTYTIYCWGYLKDPVGSTPKKSPKKKPVFYRAGDNKIREISVIYFPGSCFFLTYINTHTNYTGSWAHTTTTDRRFASFLLGEIAPFVVLARGIFLGVFSAGKGENEVKIL